MSCSALQSVAVRCMGVHVRGMLLGIVSLCVAVCCSVLQCVAVLCSALSEIPLLRLWSHEEPW